MISLIVNVVEANDWFEFNIHCIVYNGLNGLRIMSYLYMHVG